MSTVSLVATVLIAGAGLVTLGIGALLGLALAGVGEVVREVRTPHLEAEPGGVLRRKEAPGRYVLRNGKWTADL